MQPTNPESITTDERSSEIACILGIALVRSVRSLRSIPSRVSQSPEEVFESLPEALEDQEDAGLSVSALGPIGGPDPEHETQKGDSHD